MEELRDLDVEMSMGRTAEVLLKALDRVEAGEEDLLPLIEEKVREAEEYFCRPVDDPTLYRRLAAYFEKKGDAEKRVLYARKEKQKRAEEIEFLGRQQLAFGNHTRALEYYRQALELDTENVLASKDSEKARKALEKAEKILAKVSGGKDPSSRFQLSGAYLSLNMIKRAEEVVRGLLEEDPTNPDYLIRMGNVLQCMGRWEEALPYFEKALESKPNSIKAKMGRNYCTYNLELEGKM